MGSCTPFDCWSGCAATKPKKKQKRWKIEWVKKKKHQSVACRLRPNECITHFLSNAGSSSWNGHECARWHCYQHRRLGIKAIHSRSMLRRAELINQNVSSKMRRKAYHSWFSQQMPTWLLLVLSGRSFKQYLCKISIAAIHAPRNKVDTNHTVRLHDAT